MQGAAVAVGDGHRFAVARCDAVDPLPDCEDLGRRPPDVIGHAQPADAPRAVGLGLDQRPGDAVHDQGFGPPIARRQQEDLDLATAERGAGLPRLAGRVEPAGPAADHRQAGMQCVQGGQHRLDATGAGGEDDGGPDAAAAQPLDDLGRGAGVHLALGREGRRAGRAERNDGVRDGEAMHRHADPAAGRRDRPGRPEERAHVAQPFFQRSWTTVFWPPPVKALTIS